MRAEADSVASLGRVSPMRHLRPALRHPPRVLAAARAVAAELLEPMREIDIVAAEPALGQHRGDVGGERAAPSRGGIDHHAREPRRQRQLPQRACPRR